MARFIEFRQAGCDGTMLINLDHVVEIQRLIKHDDRVVLSYIGSTGHRTVMASFDDVKLALRESPDR